MSYPIIKLKVANSQMELDWFPSEYFYKERNDRYCLAIERSWSSQQIVLGATFMRQNAFIFDIDQNQVGIARA